MHCILEGAFPLNVCLLCNVSVRSREYSIYIYPHHHTKFKNLISELVFETTNYDLDSLRKYINLHPVSYMSLSSVFLTLYNSSVNVNPKMEWYAALTAFNVFYAFKHIVIMGTWTYNWHVSHECQSALGIYIKLGIKF